MTEKSGKPYRKTHLLFHFHRHRQHKHKLHDHTQHLLTDLHTIRKVTLNYNRFSFLDFLGQNWDMYKVRLHLRVLRRCRLEYEGKNENNS